MPESNAQAQPQESLETVTFTYRGVAYTADLTPDQAAAFDLALAPYIGAGRRVGGQRPAAHARDT